MRIIKLILSCSFFFGVSICAAQKSFNCYEEVLKHYDRGNLLLAKEIALSCLDRSISNSINPRFTNIPNSLYSSEIDLLKILTSICLLSNQKEEAIGYYKKILKKNSYFISNPSIDTPEFYNFSNKIRRLPIFNVNGTYSDLGSSIQNKFKLLKKNEVQNFTADSIYLSIPNLEGGFYYQISLDHYVGKKNQTGLSVGYRHSFSPNFSYNIEFPAVTSPDGLISSATLNIQEQLKYIEAPIIISRDLRGSFGGYFNAFYQFSAGIAPSYILDNTINNYTITYHDIPSPLSQNTTSFTTIDLIKNKARHRWNVAGEIYIRAKLEAANLFVFYVDIGWGKDLFNTVSTTPIQLYDYTEQFRKRQYYYFSVGFAYDVYKTYYKDISEWERSNTTSEIDYTELTSIAFQSKDYHTAYNLTEEHLKSKKVIRKKHSDILFGKSWYALFAQKPHEAIKAAQAVLKLAPKKESVATNLALGYLLNNQWEKAEEIYTKWKGKSFRGRTRLSDDIFLEDIKILEEANITHPDFEKVKTLFQSSR